jgi:RNA polymerase sigma-70 factor (ECF subfamily)
MRRAIRAADSSGSLLLERAKLGDARAFEDMIRQHQSMVFSLAYRVTQDRGAAEELAQDVFFDLYRSLDRLESAAHVTHWLRRVTSHRCIDWCRRTKPRRDRPAGDLHALTVGPMSRDVLFEARLWQIVASLAPDPRMVVILRYQEDLDPSEIANVLGMSVNTVKSHLRRSVALLRAGLEGESRAVR